MSSTKSFKIMIAAQIIVAAAFIYLVVAVAGKDIIKLFNGTEQEMKKAIGDTLVVKNDTLIITDYSIVHDNFTLSNGTKVSSEFVTKQLAE